MNRIILARGRNTGHPWKNPGPAVSDRQRTAALVLAGYCAFLQVYATQPLLPLLTRVFHTSRVAAGLTVSMASLGVAVAAPLAGMLADRIGRRKVIVGSAFLLGLSALCTSTAGSLPQLVVWRFVEGVFTPGVFAVTVAYINDEWHGGGAGQKVGAYISGTVMGGFSSRVIAGFVAAHATWPHVFLVLGALNLVLATVVAAWLPTERRHEPSRDGGWEAMVGHLTNPNLVANFAVGFCLLFALVGLFTYVTFHLAEAPYLLDPGALGGIFLAYIPGSIVTPVTGRFVDRFGHRQIIAAAILVSMAGIAITLGHPLWMILAGLGVFCTGIFSAQASASAFVGIAAKGNRALAVGLYATFYYLGGSAGAAAPAPFYSWGGWKACTAFLAVVQVATIFIALRYWKGPTTQQSAYGARRTSA